MKKMKNDEKCVGFYYSFQKSDKVSSQYSKLLCRLASKQLFFYKTKNAGITFRESFSAKIENSRLGVVAGTSGVFKWKSSDKSSTISFLVTEHHCDNTEDDFSFARHKVQAL